jgi:hypothetical protein
VYVFAGCHNETLICEAECLNLARNLWKPLAPLFCGLSNPASTVHDGHIYLTGFLMDFMLKYNPQNNIYHQHPLPLRENEVKAL